MWVCALECSAQRGQKRAEDPLELELEILGMDAERLSNPKELRLHCRSFGSRTSSIPSCVWIHILPSERPSVPLKAPKALIWRSAVNTRVQS